MYLLKLTILLTSNILWQSTRMVRNSQNQLLMVPAFSLGSFSSSSCQGKNGGNVFLFLFLHSVMHLLLSSEYQLLPRPWLSTCIEAQLQFVLIRHFAHSPLFGSFTFISFWTVSIGSGPAVTIHRLRGALITIFSSPLCPILPLFISMCSSPCCI